MLNVYLFLGRINHKYIPYITRKTLKYLKGVYLAFNNTKGNFKFMSNQIANFVIHMCSKEDIDIFVHA